MSSVVSAWVGIAALFATGLGVWIKTIQRLTVVETRQKSDDDRFAQIMVHLQRIEDKLDKKADR